MLFDLANVLVFLAIATVFLLGTLTLGRVLRPATPDAMKGTVYECGEAPIGAGWFNFNPRFLVIALVFLIFDVEVAFTYPVATVFRRWVDQGDGAAAFVEIAAFVAVLGLGLAYVWARGDLNWVRQLGAVEEPDAVPDGAPR